MENEQLIAELKAKYGKVKTIIIPTDEDEDCAKLVFHLKSPDKQTRKMISGLAEKSSEKAVMAGYRALWVGGDDVSELERNDYALISAEDALIEILKVQKATIKKN
jgi:hypothetical protein